MAGTKLASLLQELSTLEAATEKVASKDDPDARLMATLDKLAMDLDSNMAEEDSKKEEDEESEEEEKKEEDKDEEKKEEAKSASARKNKKSTKEASVNETVLVNKIANKVLQTLEKIAVQGGEMIPGFKDPNTASEGGALLQALEGETDDQQPASNVGEENVKNPNDTIKPEAPQPSEGFAEPLKNASAKVAYTREEAEVLNKLASIGYEYLVDYMSDQIVAEKVAEAYQAEKAKQGATKVAQALIAQEGPKSTRQSARDKLASAAQQDPQVLAALQVLHNRNLL